MYGIPTDTNEQWTNPGCLGCIGGEILPFVIGFIKNPIIEIPMKNSQYTLPKTNRTSHLKMDGWNLESHLQVFIRWCWGWETIPKGENSCWITWKIHGFLLQQKLHQFSRHFQKVDVYNVKNWDGQTEYVELFGLGGISIPTFIEYIEMTIAVNNTTYLSACMSAEQYVNVPAVRWCCWQSVLRISPPIVVYLHSWKAPIWIMRDVRK